MNHGIPCRRALLPACPPGQGAMVDGTLYFGLSIPGGGQVGATDWQDFVDGTVTPRFPGGLSAWPAQGQWRSNAGALVTEASQVLKIVHAGDAAANAALDAIAAAYKARFRQEAVLRTRSTACVTF